MLLTHSQCQILWWLHYLLRGHRELVSSAFLAYLSCLCIFPLDNPWHHCSWWIRHGDRPCLLAVSSAVSSRLARVTWMVWIHRSCIWGDVWLTIWDGRRPGDWNARISLSLCPGLRTAEFTEVRPLQLLCLEVVPSGNLLLKREVIWVTL